MNDFDKLNDIDQQLVLDIIRSLKEGAACSHDLRNSIDPDSMAAWWCVDDFEQRAKELEGLFQKKLYDRNKFKQALQAMMGRHDCNLGISWDTLDAYLDEYCFIGAEIKNG